MIKQKTEKQGDEVQKKFQYTVDPRLVTVQCSRIFLWNVTPNHYLTICIFFYRAYLKYWLIIFIGMII